MYKLVICNHAIKKCLVALRCPHAKPHRELDDCVLIDGAFCERPDGKFFLDSTCIPVKDKKTHTKTK